jgi:hypothetical protein
MRRASRLFRPPQRAGRPAAGPAVQHTPGHNPQDAGNDQDRAEDRPERRVRPVRVGADRLDQHPICVVTRAIGDDREQPQHRNRQNRRARLLSPAHAGLVSGTLDLSMPGSKRKPSDQRHQIAQLRAAEPVAATAPLHRGSDEPRRAKLPQMIGDQLLAHPVTCFSSGAEHALPASRVAHVAFESAAKRSSSGARPCSTVAIPRALPALLMILLSARFRHLCHHQLRLAIDYTPDHQDDQGGWMGGCRAVLRRASTRAAASARTRCRSRPRRPEPGGLRLPGASTHTASAGPCAEDRAATSRKDPHPHGASGPAVSAIAHTRIVPHPRAPQPDSRCCAGRPAEKPLADDKAEQPHKPQLISAESDVSQPCQPRMTAHRSTRSGAAQTATLATELPPIAMPLCVKGFVALSAQRGAGVFLPWLRLAVVGLGLGSGVAWPKSRYLGV